MARDRLEDSSPFGSPIQKAEAGGQKCGVGSPFEDFVSLKECFIDIRRSRDKRCSFFHGAAAPNPVEGITPAILLKSAAAALFQSVEKVDCLLEANRIFSHFIKQRKSHRVMRVSDREPKPIMK